MDELVTTTGNRQHGWWPYSTANPRSVGLIATVMAVSIFLLDLVFPVGVAAGVPYVAVVLLTMCASDRKLRYWTAVCVSILTVVGFFIPFPAGAGIWIGVENRIIALFAIWVTVFLGNLAVRRTEQLRERDARLNAVFAAASDAIITLDGEGRIVSCNPAMAQMFGIEMEDLLGRDIGLLLSPGDGSPNFRSIPPRLSWMSFHDQELMAVRFDGTSFPVEFSCSEVQTANARMYAGILRDITDRKKTQERLLQAERLAAIGQALTGLAHESRNALQRSQACIELLLAQVDQPASLELIREIQEAQDELHYLYEEVREYAVPLRIEKLPCHLVDIANEAWQLLANEWSHRDSQIRFEGDALNRPVPVDPFAMRQLFRNILENALDACPDPVRISLSVTYLSRRKQSFVQVAIRDNGPGVSAEFRGCVFDPFFTTKTRGTGLGLAICRRIVEAHGGEILVGNPGSPGAEFVIFLPGVSDGESPADRSRGRRTATATVLS